MNQGKSWFRWIVLALGFAFLYIPIASLIFYSFNASRLVTVWGVGYRWDPAPGSVGSAALGTYSGDA